MPPQADLGGAARLRELVRTRIGLALPAAREADFARAVQRATEDAALPDADALYDLLHRWRQPGAPLDALVSALNINETHFFRDANQIQALERRILPELIARRRPERRLRVWSAGCSTGEEAYTLAMLVHRLIPDLPGWDVLVLGTDINGRSLSRARRGVYRAWSLRGMPEPHRGGYLLPHGDTVEVAPQIREMVTFAQLNLAGNGYPAPTGNTHAMDLILCRNVLLYFDQAAAATAVQRLRDALSAGGWLLLSQVEASLGAVDRLEPTDVGAAFRAAPPAGPGPAPAPAPARPVPPGPAARPVQVRPPEPPAPAAHPVRVRSPEPAASGHEVVCAAALGFWRDGQHGLALGVLAAEGRRSPLRPQVHYLHGVILLDAGREAEALAAFRRCTYADAGFAPAHLGQASVLARLGRPRRAGAALAEAARLAAGLVPDDPSLAGTGLRTADLHELIAAQRQLLDTAPPATDVCGSRP